MKVSFNWLADYIDIPYSPEELANKLTMAGIEVEAIEKAGGSIPEGIIVGEILERKPHPDAENLSVCRVNTGTEELQIVCGAPNCNSGFKVPLATIGTVFEDPETGKKLKIKRSKLRGVESFGMLCSSKELGLSEDASGLLELDQNFEAGTPIEKAVKTDIIYDLEITPNRPDWLSHWGIARDIAALTGNKLKFPEIELPKSTSETPSELIKISAPDLCPRYTGRVIKNVTVKESPEWLKEKLTSIGLRPINNIVDITNFVLMELGHPLHAFNLDLLAGPQIIVRRAEKGEKLLTLDEQEHELNSENLVIADAEKPVALAGIMGGELSGVTEKTVNILLESAVFNPGNIRSSSKKLGISSDSSYRFERGADFEMAITASNRAVALILELAGGELTGNLIDVSDPESCRPKTVVCRFEKIRKLLGVKLENDAIVKIFTRLGLKVAEINDENCKVTPPSYRLDIYREADLAEEVARINGLDNIPVIPVKAVSGGRIADDSYLAIQQAISELTGLGLNECLHYSMVDDKAVLAGDIFEEADIVKLDNPISHEQSMMRPSLFIEMLNTAKRNVARKNYDLALFELGLVFCANPELYPEERNECCIALSGCKHPERFSEELQEIYDFYDLKGLLETWLENRKVKGISFRKAEDKRFEPGICAELLIQDKAIGVFGQVSEANTKGFRSKYPLFMGVVQFDELLRAEHPPILYKPISQYPPITRDVAFLADTSLEHQTIVEFIENAKVKNLEKVELFDIFQDENIGKGKKSLAYTLTFRNPDRTLTDKEVNNAHEKLRSKLASELHIELR
jgi:phenylalanyl-tRNA synthetase beta chain